MRGTVARKLRKLAKKYTQTNWKEYVEAIEQWPLAARWRFCWYILKPQWLKKKRSVNKK